MIPVGTAIITVGAFCAPLVVAAAVAWERALYWRQKAREYRDAWIAEKGAAQPFIRSLPPERRENVISVDFGRGGNAA